MARPRKATQELEITGAFKQHPERKREREGEPKGGRKLTLRDMPKLFTPQEQECWIELYELGGWLREADKPSLKMAAILMAEFETKRIELGPGLIGQLRGLLGELGFNPSKRASLKVDLEKEEEANPYAEFMMH